VHKRIIVLIQCLALAGVPLAAEGPALGGQIGLAQAQGDLSGGKWLRGRAGATAGLYSLFELGYGNALRPRADATFYPAGPIAVINGGGDYRRFTETAKASILDLALDYAFFMYGQHFEGPYVILGLGYSWASLTGASLQPGGLAPPAALPASQRARALQYALGAGWRFNALLGAEFRFSQSNFRHVGDADTIMKAPAFGLSLTVDF
jgi:hypothetical protein